MAIQDSLRAGRDPRFVTGLGLSLAASLIGGLVWMTGRRRRGLGTPRPLRALHVRKAITVGAAPDDLYDFWRNLENLPRILRHVSDVAAIDGERFHCTSRRSRALLEWNVEIVEDQPPWRIAWRSIPGSVVHHAAVVTFQPSRRHAGTIVTLDMSVHARARGARRLLAELLGDPPEAAIACDLRDFKECAERGVIAAAVHAPSGLPRLHPGATSARHGHRWKAPLHTVSPEPATF